MHLHGKQKQPTRLTIFQRFSSSKTALLICTDVAARGLDFPAVDWVVQLDCPEDVDTYIHRVGRTARYESEGKALLLCPSEEEGMLARWKEKAIEVKKIKIKESKMGNLRQQMQNFAFKEPEIKYLGQRVSRDSKSLMASRRACGSDPHHGRPAVSSLSKTRIKGGEEVNVIVC
jgi:ATP-dependent RNA helicase DDX10/DBP4